MPLDHYVSQVHINNFCSPKLGDRVYAMRKSDLKKFAPRSADVCRIEDNSSNSYLKEDRAIEKFLRGIEPKYNGALEKLRGKALDQEAASVVAGFAAYVWTCSPTGMRLHSSPLKNAVETFAIMLDARGQMPKAPASFGNKSMTELLNEGSIEFKIDEKYPQAIGIAAIEHVASVLGNSTWEILTVGRGDNPLFTSDFPIAIEAQHPSFPIINRIVPLAPNLAVRFIPDLRRRGEQSDFANVRVNYRTPRHNEVFHINRLIVQCSEDLVLYRDERSWVDNIVTKNRAFRIEAITEKIPHGKGYLLPAFLRVQPRTDSGRSGR